VTDKSFGTVVLNSKLPVLVDFWAPGCGPCAMVGPIMDQLAAKYAGRVKVCKCNVTENTGLAQRLGIRSVPTVVLVADGSLIDVIVGVKPASRYVKLIEQAL